MEVRLTTKTRDEYIDVEAIEINKATVFVSLRNDSHAVPFHT